MPIRDLSTLEFGQLLGSLLSAIVTGQNDATAASLAQLEQIGLVHDNGDERFRTVTFRYTKLDENQNPAEFTLEIPLLAMVAIPTLVVRNAKVSFSYDVTDSVVTEPDTRAATPRLLGDLVAKPVRLRGVVHPQRGTQRTQETAGIDVEVVVESAPLPLGLERLVELTELTVSNSASRDTA